MRRVLITSTLIFFFISLGTLFAILYAKGYRVNKTRIEGTGILVASSKPDGARVSINGHLTTATNSTLNLSPGDYDVRIEKDGYFPWSKKITIKKELVREANATLFPIAPKLEAITITGANNPVLDSTGTLIAYTLTSSLLAKSGIYVLDMNARPIISIGGATTQIADNTTDRFSEATISFSPDNRQLLASISGNFGQTSYLLTPRSFNQNPQDVTTTLLQVEADWAKLTDDKNRKIMDSLPKKVRDAYVTYFKKPLLSPDSDRIVYTASISASLPILKNPRWTSVNSTPEDRNLIAGKIYVYDIKEDRNYFIYQTKTTKPLREESEQADVSIPTFIWLADSNHLAFIEGQTINAIESDGTNKTTLYAGPFVNHYLYSWPDGSSLVILTNLNIPDAPNNLYRISLK